MACLELDSSHQGFDETFALRLEDSISAEVVTVPEASTSSLCQSNNSPKPPPLPGACHVRANFSRRLSGCSHVPTEIKHTWDEIFKEGYRTDVRFLSDKKEIILAHSCVLVSILNSSNLLQIYLIYFFGIFRFQSHIPLILEKNSLHLVYLVFFFITVGNPAPCPTTGLRSGLRQADLVKLQGVLPPLHGSVEHMPRISLPLTIPRTRVASFSSWSSDQRPHLDVNAVSPVLRNLLNQTKVKGGYRCIKIPGVPSEAISAFVRFLYSSSYEPNVMGNYVLHLLVLSHTFSVPPLKRVCTNQLEGALLTTENVIDVLQLARECDAPRLSLFCTRLILKEFRKVSTLEGWKVMKQANPDLEQELLECLVEADSRTQEKMKKKEEKKMYLQLSEAMEALLHICRDGCQSIGPRDKILKSNQVTCNFPACKGLESLVRHFSACKTRVPGGCTHCKRMWQLFELHSHMCAEPDSCKVPLCRHFRDKVHQQSKKEDMKWRLLVSKVRAAKGTIDSISARRCLLP